VDLAEATRRIGVPAVVALRPVLHGALVDAVGVEHIALESEVVGAASDSSRARITLAGDGIVEADAVIAADGVGSSVRRQLHPDEPPARSSGLFALRGVAHAVTAHLGGVTGAQYLGRGIEAGVARASDTAVYWYLSLPAALVGGERDARRVLARAIAGFHAPFRAIVEATADSDLRLDELFEREPLERWGAGRVTLLGDAAHPMLPHAGQGAAQALEDAVVLARALAREPDVAAALRQYEAVRAPRTRAMVRLSRRNARLTAVTNPVACALRDAVISRIPEGIVLRQMVALGTPPAELNDWVIG
jgi:2-polyprenyl-6-methoxyphenol hydroxylase-like FAD-dependent oxidoreductase